MAVEPVTITRTYDRPVTKRKKLGSVPLDKFEHTHFPKHGIGSIKRVDQPQAGPVPIPGRIPVYDENGNPKMETVTVTLSEKPYDPKKRAVVCGALGAAAGLLVAGTGPIGWAAAGAAGLAGAVFGKKSAENDEVREKWVKPPILHPEMKGHYHVTAPIPEKDRDGDWQLKGYLHHYHPNIDYKKVGEYEKPTLQHDRKVSGMVAGALAAGAGLALGWVLHKLED